MLTELRSAGANAPSDKSVHPRRDPARFLLFLAGSWALAVAAHLIGLDWLLLPVIWLGTASLLRIGTTLLDRLVPALGLVAGLLIIGGYVTTLWPWGLAPVPIGGAALTILVVASYLTGRRPQMPRRVTPTDVTMTAGGVLAGLLAAKPTMATTGLGWAAYAGITGDRLRQFNLFDTIRVLGGYPAVQPHEAAPMLESSMLPAYPAGMHYVYAVIDSFMTGTTDPGRSLDALQRYHWYVLISYAVFAVTVAWAARYLAPGLAAWKQMLATTTILLFLATGIYTTGLWEGFDAQTAGMLFLALLVAVLARPTKSVGEQLLLAGALTVAVAHTYTLYAVFAAIAVLAALAIQWRRLKRHPRMLIAAAVFFGAAASLQVVIPALQGFEASDHVNATGFIIVMPRTLAFALLALAAVALVRRGLTRSPRLRVLAITNIAGLLFAIGLWIYNVAFIGTGSYYFEKVVYALAIVNLVTCAGALAHVKPRLRLPVHPGVTAVAMVLLAAVITGTIPSGPAKYNHAEHQPGPDTNWVSVYGSGTIYAGFTPALTWLAQRGLVGDGVPTQIVFSSSGVANQQLTLVTSILNRNIGGLYRQIYGVELTGLRGHEPGDKLDATTQTSLDLYKLVCTESKVPLRVITNDPGTAAILREFAATNPGAGLTVILAEDLPGEGPPPTT
ncbi:hypothetical protein Afil01_39020 [Actinorhabdospora filicis]|uniref:Uncharacterized protein n=1 Tax=Actinorhabdospora filicis TaxID=1785913 RepID=A0A9W6SNF4_9ACTN|nr:hypothetical protein [Actinorhabdospora filicis]GLZ79095.1 hypothetical protein Afil01_39020 [Actinorhabdospora filicis]